MNIEALFDEPGETEAACEPSPVHKMLVAANDNSERENLSPYSKQVRMTPFLHAEGLGAFPSDELPKFINYYLLPKGGFPSNGYTLRLTDDNGDDVWAAVIPEYDPWVGEPWGVETYTTEEKANAALAEGLLEAEAWREAA